VTARVSPFGSVARLARSREEEEEEEEQ